MFSQSNEDEIIEDIFSRIGTTNKRFVEFGCGDGRQNNTIALLHQGWRGLWFERHRRRFKSAQERFYYYPVRIVRRRVIPEKVNKFVQGEIDFLSIDVDGDDYAIWEAMTARARVVCIEYGDPRGAPFDAIADLGLSKGYTLVDRSASNVNAFFVDGLTTRKHQ